jgi:hypothetical protein
MGPRVFGSPIQLSSAGSRHAFISETAFLIWKSSLADGESVDAMRAQVGARQRLSAVRRQVDLGPDLSYQERGDAEAIAAQLLHYFTEIKDLSDISIDAKLPGCGPILGGSPDIMAVDSSYGVDVQIIGEIKSVNRKFRSTDLRQLIAYVVLYFAFYGDNPDVMMVVNPLLGHSLETGVDNFFEVTTGRPSREVIAELLFDWSTAGVSL